jgi:hypothetical protein
MTMDIDIAARKAMSSTNDRLGTTRIAPTEPTNMSALLVAHVPAHVMCCAIAQAENFGQ